MYASKCTQVRAHPFIHGGAEWEPLGGSIYSVRTDMASGAVYADEQLVGEMEAAGYPRQMVLQVGVVGCARVVGCFFQCGAHGGKAVVGCEALKAPSLTSFSPVPRPPC